MSTADSYIDIHSLIKIGIHSNHIKQTACLSQVASYENETLSYGFINYE